MNVLIVEVLPTFELIQAANASTISATIQIARPEKNTCVYLLTQMLACQASRH
jgi:hypothetical protein